MDLAELRIRVDSSDVRKAAGDLDRLQGEARETQAAAGKVEKGMGTVAGSAAIAARNLFAVVGGVAAARAGLQRAEAYTNLTNSLKALGQSAEEANATIEQIAAVAQRTRSPLESTAKLYTRLSIAADEVGASQQDVLKFTETTAKALAASGTSASEASGALIQLSQAMAGGVVRAEEFNSILEGAFPIAQAAADGIEEAAGSVGKLRQLVVDGKVSSEEFFNAILSQSDAIDQAFGNTATTLSQAFTQLSTSVTLLIGGLDGDSGLSGALAGVVSEAAMFVDSLRGLENLDTIATSIAAVGAAALALVFPFSAAAVAVGGAAIYLFRNWETIRERFPGIVGALEGAAQLIGGAFSVVWNAVSSIGEAALENLDTAITGIDLLLQGDFRGAMDEFKTIGENLKNIFVGLSESWMPALSAAWGSVKEVFSGWLRDVKQLGVDIARSIAQGFANLGAEMVAAARRAWSALVAEIEQWPDRMVQYGRDMVQGLINGLTSMQAETGSAGRNVADRLSKSVKEELGIQSPSKVFHEIGENTVEGMVNGILGTAKDVEAAIKSTVGGAVDAGSRLADGVADVFGGLFTGAYESAEDALGAIKDLFLSTLKDMITAAIRNPIQMFFQGQGAGGGGVAQAALGGQGGGLFGGFSSGLQSVISGFGSGGFGGAASAIGSALSGISGGGLAGIGAALGAVAVPIAAITAVVSFFQTKTTELDRGLRITIGEVDTLVESFRKVEKSRFWGLSKTTKTTYDRLGEAAAQPIVAAVDMMQKGIIDMAESVGVAAEAFDGFTYRVRISTRDRDAQEAVQAALKGAADAMAELAFAGTEGAEDLAAVMRVEKELADVRAASARAVAASGLTNPLTGAGNVEATRTPEYRAYKSAMDEVTKEFDAQVQSLTMQLANLKNTRSVFIREGETASEALERLSVSLTTVNAQFEFMGRQLFDVSIASADLASQLVDLFGGAEAFATATTRYIELFYTEAERAELITNSLTNELEAFGIALPTSRDRLRELVDGLDLTTERGRELYAVLIQNADAFDTILPRVASLSMVLQQAFEFAAPLLDEAARQSQESARAFEQSSRLWFRTAETLRDFISDLRGTDLGGASAASQLQFNRDAFEAATAAARAGDQAAAAQIPELGRAFLASARETAATTEEFRAVAARVTAESQLIAGISNLEGAIDGVISDLFEQNVAAIQELADAVAAGADVDEALAEFGPKVDDLAAAIEGLQELSYAGLQEALDNITVDLRTRDDIPRYLRDIITGEAGNLSKTLEFVVRRNDLTPEQVFIAANTVSSLVKSIQFVVQDATLSDKVIDLALSTSSQIRRGLVFQLERPLPEPLQTFALTAYDTLARGVLLTLESDSDNAAKRIALDGIGDYVATVRATMAPDSEVSDRVRRIVYNQAGTYVASIGAVISSETFGAAEKRILLRQTGRYIARIGSIIDEDDDRRRALLLRENTQGFREIILSPKYRDGLGAWTDFIRGGSDGKVQLGGTISFDPTSAFESTLAEGIREPFELAAQAMDVLKEALDRDAELQREANQLQRLANLREVQNNVLTEAQGIFDQIRALEERFNVRLVESQTGRAARFGVTDDGLLDVSRNRAIEYVVGQVSDAQVNAFRDALRPLTGRLEDLFGVPASLNKSIDRLSENLGIPGFARGGSHRGGLRIVGENGPELEATGPSRIYSNSQMRGMMGGNDALLAEIRMMRAELKRSAEQTATNTNRLRKIEEARYRVEVTA